MKDKVGIVTAWYKNRINTAIASRSWSSESLRHSPHFTQLSRRGSTETRFTWLARKPYLWCWFYPHIVRWCGGMGIGLWWVPSWLYSVPQWGLAFTPKETHWGFFLNNACPSRHILGKKSLQKVFKSNYFLLIFLHFIHLQLLQTCRYPCS